MRVPVWIWLVGLVSAISAPAATGRAADWPTYRADATRSGYTPQVLPAKGLQLHWERQLATPRPAWPPEQGKLQFDASYEPVVADGRLFVGSMAQDAVFAYDSRTGEPLWRYYTEGPVRVAPAVWNDRVLAACDDGRLYCLDAATGKLHWRFQGGPKNRKLLGNDRLISSWPARGGPVIVEDQVYFTAGIWPFMGIFIYAVDIPSGKVVWTNSGSGSEYLTQPHNSPAFAGVAPQGYLAANENLLLIAGGRTTPAAFRRKDGKFQYFRPGDRTLGKSAGGFEIVLGPNWYANHGGLYGLDDGKPWGRSVASLISPRGVLALQKDKLQLLEPRAKLVVETKKDRKGKDVKRERLVWQSRHAWKLAEAANLELLAADTLVASDADRRQLLFYRLDKGATQLALQKKIALPGSLWRVIAADDRLYAVTRAGRLLCFAEGKGEVRSYDETVYRRNLPIDSTLETAVRATKVERGYAVLYRYRPDWLHALVRATRCHILVLEPDSDRVDSIRRALAAAGLLGTRVAILDAKPRTGRDQLQLAPYLARLIVCPEAADAKRLLAGKLAPGLSLKQLRPYGGKLLAPATDAQHAEWNTLLTSSSAPSDGPFRLQRTAQMSILERPGGLPGAGSWTHHNGDAANALVSQDKRVKAPLGVLWFGGPSNREVLPRHGHGPTPQVLGGRLFIEGPNMLRAVDVYTGQLLWQRALPGIGMYYDNTGHHPGASAIGGNYVTTSDAIYVAYGRKCLLLDPASGATRKTFSLPPPAGRTQSPYWGFLAVSGDLLIGGAEPIEPFTKNKWDKNEPAKKAAKKAAGKGKKTKAAPQAKKSPATKPVRREPRFAEGSRELVVMNRHTGQVLWRRTARYNFRHNTIVAAGGKIFCIDRMTAKRLEQLRRRGVEVKGAFTLYALDAATGKVVWQTDKDVFGTWLGYSAAHNVLLQAGSAYRDRAKDEVGRGMILYRADKGDVVWAQPELAHQGPPMLLGDRIIMQQEAFDLHTGKPLLREGALNRATTTWRYTRNYGCNTAIGCPNLLAFRSAAAGYYDLAGDSGTGNLGGFRSSCTSNLVPADGVLNAPDYTRTCTCSYQNQCSLALIHMPDVEMWTFRSEVWDGKAVDRLGLNFGAPGDRRGADGLLWLDFPSVGGTSPDIPVKAEGSAVRYVRRHSSEFTGVGPDWVHASGVRGVQRLRLTLDKKDKTAKRYRVGLYFSFVDRLPSTSRLRVRVVGSDRVAEWDLAKAAGAANHGIVRELTDLPVRDVLHLEFEQLQGEPPLLNGLEIRRQP